MHKLVIWILLSLAAALAPCAAAQDDATPEPPEGQAVITHPAPGDAVFGEVPVVGAAEHPAFRRFELDFATADAPDDWLQVQEAVSQQVPVGVLGVWDVSGLPDGVYRLRLRVFARDDTWLEAIVDDIEVANTQPTAVPTILPPPTAGPTVPPPTAGPSPTPIIKQPPTSTPRPGGGAAMASTGAGPVDEDNWLSGARLQEACCNGVYLVMLVGVGIGLYMTIRSNLRPWLRRTFRRRR
ncbi:MAG: hypothetical protein JXB47_11235 [Anaerolineae bacterium]|nr:hypothetical protein [Anaerolineae bacterium]